MREGVFPVRQCPPGAPSAQCQGQAASGAVLANCPRLQSLQGRPEGRARFLLAPGVTGCFVSSHRTVPRGDVISSFPYGSGRHLSKNSSSWPAFHPPVSPTVSISAGIALREGVTGCPDGRRPSSWGSSADGLSGEVPGLPPVCAGAVAPLLP